MEQKKENIVKILNKDKLKQTFRINTTGIFC